MPNHYIPQSVAVVSRVLPCPGEYRDRKTIEGVQPDTRCLVCYVETGVFLRPKNGCGCSYHIHFACFCTYLAKIPQPNANHLEFICPVYCQSKQIIRSTDDVKLEFIALSEHIERRS